ncbi:GGDEF domain-containing protein [Orrella sp. JC864]|uniref:GGDEF domain-containing protein n=1 Tax=Orrella sp. JC864 TaxID=3120298 RepID=UPI0030092368
MRPSTVEAPGPAGALDSHDLFASEQAALEQARAALSLGQADAGHFRQALLALTGHYERLLRETRRLVRRSDRAEREMNALNLQLQQLAAELRHRATHDALTGVLNRSAIIEAANRYLAEGELMMIVLDIDEFKRVNDDFGHPAGDAVILGIADCLRRVVGEAGVVGRVGGEEFTVLLPRHSLAQACEAAHAMRQAIAQLVFPPPVDRQVTASFGVSANAQGAGFDQAYGLADDALYRAKRGGRNRVIVAGENADMEPAS